MSRGHVLLQLSIALEQTEFVQRQVVVSAGALSCMELTSMQTACILSEKIMSKLC